jgi:hypothetical protein
MGSTVFRAWFAANRSLAITVTSAVLVSIFVAVAAIASTGFTAQQLDLNDSSVWVANGTQQAIGRANTTVRQLNSVVQSTGNDLDVLQQGSTVILVDNASSKLEMIDPATSTVTDTVPLPPNQPQVYLTANNVVILAQATGQVWITPIDDLSSFNSQSAPTLTLGAGAVASMDTAGTMFIYSPTTKQVDRIQPDESDALVSTNSLALPTKDTLSITSVNDQWAVLDATSDRVYLEGGSVSLRGSAAATSPAIQVASATGDEFLVAGSTGVVGINLGGSTATTVLSGQSGIPARPLSSDGCDFAAWTGGHAWRRCSDGATTMPLAGITSGSKLELRQNGNRVVLNDSHSGATWAVQSDGQLINNWNDLIAANAPQQQQQQNEDKAPQVEKQEVPPVAVDDSFGARPGRTSLLPVLLNDYDPNGDVLVITNVSAIDERVGHIDLINNRQELQMTLTASASGVINFRYTISDGRGGTASANVAVTVRSPGENSAPQQARTSKTTVVEGGRVTTQVLGDWVDPDGDAMYVTGASTTSPNSVSFTPQGAISYADAGKTSGLETVAVTVSDGKASTTGNLEITVQPSGKVPLIADPFMQVATAGEPLTISPLDHVRGGSATIRLNSVPAKAGVTITPSYSAGTFRFESSDVATHYLDYVVTDGQTSATGVIRVDVIAPPASNSKPITIPKTLFVRPLSSASIDVADADIDPAGGVLLVTGVSNLPTGSGLSAEILQQQSVRVTLTKPIAAPVTFDYTVSNGLASAPGSITVIEIPNPTHLQPPIANNDSVTVRAGAAVDIPVLNNDVDPDGEPLTLVPTLPQSVPAGDGLLFASGSVLRFLAPEKPGNYTAIYAVAGPDGQTARAQVTISVRQVDANTNNPPVPQTLSARVLSGGTVTIPVPLSGIDPDGDTVTLVGTESNPEKGIVTAVGADTITYKAGDYSAGTDSFEYSVVDSLGARATGTIRVGIAARTGVDQNPIATLDAVTVRPGVTVSVQVLQNDSDPNGSPLHVVSAVPNDKVTTATVEDNIVSIKPPDTPGVYGVVYTIANATGGQSSAFVRVTVDPNAPLDYPVASDTVLTLNDILNRTQVDVNVLNNVFFADGPASELGLSVYPGYEGTAQVTSSKHILVDVTAHSQIIPFKVTNPQDPNIFGYAFIWVPGTNDALPQLNRDAPTLTVTSGSKLTINLNDEVIAAGGKQVQLTSTSSVTATHSDGSSLVIDSQTLQFVSAPQYFGPASISFEVTDGQSPSDPNGRKATLSLPITVLPKVNQPPVFTGGTIDFQPGQNVTVNLVNLTDYPYQSDLSELSYTLVAPLPTGFTTKLSGQQLTISANENAAKGLVAQLGIAVRDSTSVGTPGSIQLDVVPSTRPLAQAAPDTAVVQRGQTTTIDVLANDNATNPFPDTPLSVITIEGLDGGSLPAGVSVSPSADRSRLTVSVSASASPGNTTFQYEIADATGDSSRYVWGNVTILVEDKPDPVTNVTVTGFSDRQLTVNWNPGASNNSAISEYDVIMTNAANGNALSTTACGGPLCSVTTPGNGPSNAVRLSVVAKNSIGTSSATSFAGAVWSDVIPGAPTLVNAAPLNHGLRITWSAPPSNSGSAITSYVITVDGASPQTVDANTFSVDVTSSAIANGSSVNFSVSARNSSYSGLTSWNSASGTGFPAGPPLYDVTNPPTAATPPGDESGTNVTVSWPAAFDGNGAAITDYRAAEFKAGDAVPTCGSSTALDAGMATSLTFTGLTSNTQYSFVVFATNAMGCGVSGIVSLTPRATPGTVSAVTTSGSLADGTNLWDFELTGATIGSGSTASDSFEYQLVGGSVDGSVYGPLSYGSFLTTSNNSQYGNSISVEVKACQQYQNAPTLCSDNWSAAFPVGVPVDNSDLPGLTFTQSAPFDGVTAVTGTWNWTAGLPLGFYDSITYNCGDGNGEQSLDPNNPGSCTSTETSVTSNDFPSLTITIAANGTKYVRTYHWNNYD